MISQLKGTVDSITLNKVTLDVRGVGYELCCSSGCLAGLGLGQPAVITVHTHVREDAITLFGFADLLEKQVFLLLNSVQGVGPRSAAEIVSNIDKVELLRTIGQGDASQLQRIKGVGKKLSERIIVELRDKVSEFVQGNTETALLARQVLVKGDSAVVDDATSALVALGFSRKDAEAAVSRALQTDGIAGRDSGKLVSDALRYV